MPRAHASQSATPRALVVDDELQVRELVAEVLRLDGFEVRQADRAERALEFLTPGAFDVVVSDLRMPGLGGFHLLVETKRIDPTTPFILMTGFGDVESSVEALRLGADDFLAKPIQMAEFRRTVEKAVEKGRLLRENQQQKERLEHLYRVKSRFLADMSHELRTPLTTIIGMSEVLAEGVFGGLGQKQQRYVGSIRDSARHLLNLINDILDYSKIEAGKMELEPSPFSPAEAMQGAASLVEWLASARGMRLDVQPYPAGKSAWGDRDKVVQVLVNLLSNAIKFSPEGSVVTLRCAEGSEALRFRVEDQGTGIAADSLEAVFEEFQQAGVPMSGKPPGTGLGLALSRKLARLHGGDIQVESVFGSGSTFTFVLPRERVVDALPDPAAAAVPAPAVLAVPEENQTPCPGP